MGSSSLAVVLQPSRAILFDFDGPICDVFTGYPAPAVARHLAGILAQYSMVLGNRALAMDDPMEILRLAPQGGDRALRRIEEELTAAEVEAVELAGFPIPGGVAALEAALASGRKVAVVSNNSGECVRAFLMRHGLSDLVNTVVGRVPYRPEMMKPDPHLLLLAASRLNMQPHECTLIGDSATDVEAARSSGTSAIGFANKPGKGRALEGADAVITDMNTVAEVLKHP